MAEKFTAPDPSRDLQNLVFYPHAKIFSLVTSYQSSISEVGPTLNSSATESKSTSTSYSQIPITLSYGVTDRVRFSIAQTELIQQIQQSTNINSGALTTNSSSGPSSTSFSIIWRYLNSPTKNKFADFNMTISPQNGTHLAATSGQVGNNLNAATNTTLSLPFYWYFSDEEVEINLSAIYHSNGVSQGPTAATSTFTPDQYVSGSIAISERSHINNKLYLQPILTVSLPYSYSYINQGSGVQTLNNYATTLNPQIQLGYLPKSWCLFTFAISYSSSSYSSTAPPSTANQTTDYDSTTSAGVRILF